MSGGSAAKTSASTASIEVGAKSDRGGTGGAEMSETDTDVTAGVAAAAAIASSRVVCEKNVEIPATFLGARSPKMRGDRDLGRDNDGGCGAVGSASKELTVVAAAAAAAGSAGRSVLAK